MKLSDQFKKEGIVFCHEKKAKEELLADLVNLLCETYSLQEHRQKLLESVLERESQMSTGIGCGLGVPHAKVDFVKEMSIAAMVIPEGTDFSAIDKEPVYLLFLVVSPSHIVGPHIKALSSVSRLMADAQVRRELIESKDAETFYSNLKTAEERYI